MLAVAWASVTDAMLSAVGATVTDVVVEVIWAGLLLSVTVAVKVEVPMAVAVPEIMPLDGARFSPAGSLPDAIFHW